MPLTFTWDSEKAEANLRKHGVSFEEAATVFGDPLSLTIPNPEHSVDEPRFLVVGYSFRQNLLVVAHSEIDDTIRIISARRATTHERQDYEEG